MTERDPADTEVRQPTETAPVAEPAAAPAVDAAAATPDRDPSTGGESSGSTAEERPELFVAGAFAGGLALALLLKWLGPDE